MIKMKAVYFARVSTREQAEEGYSLSAQEKLLQEYAEKHGFTIVKKFAVPETARGTQERELIKQFSQYVDDHKDIKIILCEKIDRKTRNFKDAVKIEDWINDDGN